VVAAESRRPPGLSIIFLMYNEEGSIAAVLDEALAFCRQTLDDWEILVINDGSTDGSPAIVAEYAAREPRLRRVDHATNGGMGAGMRTGIEHASKPWFIFNASDGQVPCAEIGTMLPVLDRADIVLTTYLRRADHLGRKVMSRGLRWLLRAAAGIRFELEGLYLYPTAVARELLPRIGSNSFVFSFELIQRGVERGLTTETIQIRCLPRMAGESKVVSVPRIRRVATEVFAYRQRRLDEAREASRSR
jgi:glycosyltransferase involved in cell wall biosynthesis